METERRTGHDRRSDKSTEERLDEIEKGYKARSAENRRLIEKFARWTFVILSVLTVFQLGLGLVSVKLLSDNNGQSDDIASTVNAIQEQRLEAIWDGCRSQNFRHDLTVARLQALVDVIKDPVQKARAESNIASTVSLIDALAPPQDCTVVIADRFHLKGTTLEAATHRLEARLGSQRPSRAEIQAAREAATP